MKVFISTAVILFISISWSFYPSTTNNDLILDQIKDIYWKDIDSLKQNVKQFSEELDKTGPVGNDLQSLFFDLRKQYKRVEPLLIYFQEEGVIRSINGAPLPKVDPVAPSLEVKKPSGLQAIEEAVCENDIELTKTLFQNFEKDLALLLKFEQATKLKHRFILESLRLLDIRIYTLSMTAFDTPACSDALQEAIVGITVLEDYLRVYKANIKEQIARKLLTTALDKLAKCRQEMEASDFDHLPRLKVLREYLMPVYGLLYDIHSALNIEYVNDIDPISKPFDYHKRSFFETDFLNPSFFAKVANSDLDDPRKIALGKLLFFDPVLSRDLSMACASCHHPGKAFTDGLAKSKSRNGESTLRNSPTLINAVYANKYFLDVREHTLERQVKHVMYDRREFDMDFVDLADRLKESNEYVHLFKEAYGDRDKYIISTWSISNALAAYVSSLRSYNSPFDKYVRQETNHISPDIEKGHDLFMGKASCGTCHFAPTFAGVVPPTFIDTESEVLGVLIKHDTINPVLDTDPGRAANSRPRDGVNFYVGSFKTTTVRNIELTAPYFHNGAYETLEDVLDFYNRGGGAGMGLDVPYQTLPDAPLNLTTLEKNQIISFMRSLTDTVGLTSIPYMLPQFEKNADFNNRKPRFDYK